VAIRGTLDEADGHGHRPGRRDQGGETAILASHAEGLGVWCGQIVGERQLGKNEQVHAAPPRLDNAVEMRVEIGGNIAWATDDLRCGYGEARHGNARRALV